MMMRNVMGLATGVGAASCVLLSRRTALAAKREAERAARRTMSSSKSGTFKMALLQLMVSEDKERNLAATRKAIAEASKNGASVVSLPECFQSPYATDQFPVYAEEIPENLADCDASKHPSTTMLREAAKENKVYLIGGSIPEREGDRIYNTCVVVDPSGSMIAKHRKVHLFDIDVPGGQRFKESDTLSGGNCVTTFDTPFCKIGLAICYDIRFPELSQIMREEGCKVLVFPAAFNTTTGPLHWELLLRARAVDQQCYVAASSPARNPESNYQAWGYSSVVDPWGKVVAGGDGICEGPGAVYAEIDLETVDTIRQSIPVGFQRRADIYKLERTS
eukprot:g2256.t1